MFKLFSNILTLLIAGVTFVCPVALIKECFILQSNQRRGKDQFYITMAIDKVLKDLIMSWVTTLHSQLVFSWIYNHGYRSQPFMLVEKKSLWRKNCLDLYFLLLFFFFFNLNNLIWTYHHTTFEYEFSTHVFWLAFFSAREQKSTPWLQNQILESHNTSW